MNAKTRNRKTLLSLSTAGLLALATAVAAPVSAKSDKPYHEAPEERSAGQSRREQPVAAEYLYICRVGSAIKYRIEPREAEFFDLGSSGSEYRLAPRLGTCA